MATLGSPLTTSPETPPTAPIQAVVTAVGPTGGLIPEGDYLEPTTGQIWPR